MGIWTGLPKSGLTGVAGSDPSACAVASGAGTPAPASSGRSLIGQGADQDWEAAEGPPPTSLRLLRRRGGAVGAFSDTRNTCLFIGGQKYWLITHWDTDNLDGGNNCMPSWVRLNRDWRDFVESRSTTGERQDQPEESVSLGDAPNDPFSRGVCLTQFETLLRPPCRRSRLPTRPRPLRCRNDGSQNGLRSLRFRRAGPQAQRYSV